MSESKWGSGVKRRMRLMVPLGVAAATAIGGLVIPAVAHADTDVQGENDLTVSLNIGAQTVNDGVSGWSANNNGTVKVINSSGQAQNANTGAGDYFAVYTSVAGAGITQDMVNSAPGNGMLINGLVDKTTPLFLLPSTLFFANCPANTVCAVNPLSGITNGFPQNLIAGNATPTHISSNMTSQTLPFDIRVDSRTAGTHALTGPVTFTTEVVELDTHGHLVRILGGASATTNLGNPAAPVVNSAPKATVDQPYDFQLVNLGFPAVPELFPGAAGAPQPTVANGGDYHGTPSCTYVENNHPKPDTKPGDCLAGWKVWAHNANGSIYLVGSSSSPNFLFLAPNGHWTYYLPYNFNPSLPISPSNPQNGSFFLDTATGHLYANEYQQAQANGSPTTYIIEVNNGIGGATWDDELGGNPFAGVAPIHLHDVFGTLSVATGFTDVSTTNPFYNAIQLLSNDGIIEGYADGTFRPGVNVSRSQFAHMMAEYLNFAIQTSPSPNGGNFITTIGTGACNDVNTGSTNITAFPDVPATSQFCAEVVGLAERGIIHGYKDGTFKPAQSISRGEMSAILWRAHEYYLGHSMNGGDGDLPCSSAPFSDVPTSNVFCGDISWLKSHNISKGYSDGTYHPAASITRGETAQMVFNLGSYDIVDFQYLKPVVP